ncbi:hypothetical protein BDZ45DRAFT_730116 [Acephala macrosclerotiorum]|nr:hypothetical protein BDZ45DRAFT_730116 [Acephala macrosclerotiorum]
MVDGASSTNEMANGRDPFSVSSTNAVWPLRLLHISTMTSFQRNADNVYTSSTSRESFKEPEYNVLSYTWGRWACEEGPALSINNITWKVPSVSADCFSTEEFRTVIKRASRDVLFIWVDIACIDQEDHATKMFEIGRQAGIFNGARTSYIWLHLLSAADLQRQADELLGLAAILEEATDNNAALMDDDEEDQIQDSGDNYAVPMCPNTLGSRSWCNSVVKVLDGFRRDPWFTSLWTLQEMYLRPQGILLSRDACPAYRLSSLDGNQITVANLIIQTNIIHDAVTKCLRDTPGDLLPNQELLEKIVRSIQQLGFEGSIFNNPCVVYSASCHRNSIDINDRIYGIMQVFDFKLGTSREPHRIFTLEQLEIQLGAALNLRSPVWAQLFVHSHPSQAGKAWLVDQYATVPQQLLFAETIPESMCTITVDDTETALFKGRMCSFQSMCQLWRDASGSLNREDGSSYSAVQTILLDATVPYLTELPNSLRNLSSVKDARYHVLADALLSFYGHDLHMLLVGKLLEATDDDQDESVGIIVSQINHQGHTKWQRLGLSLWSSTSESLIAEERIWKSVEVKLG